MKGHRSLDRCPFIFALTAVKPVLVMPDGLKTCQRRHIRPEAAPKGVEGSGLQPLPHVLVDGCEGLRCTDRDRLGAVLSSCFLGQYRPQPFGEIVQVHDHLALNDR
jgi:hypothetical protein